MMGRGRVRVLSLLGGVVLSLAGCSSSPVERSVDSRDAIIYGSVVVGKTGAPVQGARVYAEHRWPGCSGNVAEDDSRSASGENGRYRVYFRSLGGLRENSCFTIRAQAGSSASPPTPFTVELRWLGDGQRPDSVRVDLDLAIEEAYSDEPIPTRP